MTTALLAFSNAAEASDAELGEELYMRYCASCHGVDADGRGPVARYLRRAPADLRLLAEKYGRPLPRDEIAEFIDGRRDVDAHGPREMPVWGRELDEFPPAPDGDSRTRELIDAILDYLESIQTVQQTAR